jgi:threonine dehydratase
MRYLERILRAHVYEVAVESPLEVARRLSARLGVRVLLKREELQPTVFCFKLRGAYNKMAQLSEAQRKCGVIASSAGNHAQGVALAAQRMGVRATVVVPETAPAIKVQAVEALGAEVRIASGTYDEAQAEAKRLAGEQGLTFIPPFDDPDVIAGQGTIGMEILRQHPDPITAIFAPVGGGSLISGVAAYVKALRPEIEIIGVEPEDAASMTESLRAGRQIELPHVGVFADGVAVRRVGVETFRLCRELVDDMVLVDTDETCAAIKDVFEDTRGILEPAGALAVAGLKRYVQQRGDAAGTYICINSGANLNFDRLRHVAERAELGEGREAILAVEIPERKGSFLAFCKALGRRQVTEFNYRLSDPTTARIFVGLELRRGAAERGEVVAQLRREGYTVVDLSQNELAKLHVRHLVGGVSDRARDERLFRFEFPERPGALLRFLEAVGHRFNISLFHYRNHGSDYGRVLAGIQAAEDALADLHAHLRALGYWHVEESENEAYRLFLAPER